MLRDIVKGHGEKAAIHKYALWSRGWTQPA